MFEGKVQCPRCGKIHTLPQASPGIYCDCHLWCQHGSKPSDCNLTAETGTIQWKYPEGAHTNDGDEGDDVVHRTAYCSVHKVYSYKTPVWLEVNWETWYQKRAPRKFREIRTR